MKGTPAMIIFRCLAVEEDDIYPSAVLTLRHLNLSDGQDRLRVCRHLADCHTVVARFLIRFQSVEHVVQRELESLRFLVVFVVLNCDYKRLCKVLDSLKGEALLADLDLSILYHVDTFLTHGWFLFEEIFRLKAELNLGLYNDALRRTLSLFIRLMTDYHVGKGEAWNLNIKVDIAAVIRRLGACSLFTDN